MARGPIQYWWVNHKQTSRQEVEGRYLWSPKVEKGGKRSQFYDNMRDASPGDLVLSYADGIVRWVGRVSDFAFTAPKPTEYGTTGEYWNATGWRLPVVWMELAEPVRPKAILTDVAPLLPAKYSPINPLTGNGNQKAYLAEISEDAFSAILSKAAFDPAVLYAMAPNRSPFEEYIEGVEEQMEEQVWQDAGLDATVKIDITQARRGQGLFRSRVLQLEPRCRITGITDPNLLIASHIKPWRFCSTAFERLDGANGFMLTPDADLLFDRGFMSFEKTGEITWSERVDPQDLVRLGLPLEGNVGPFRDDQKAYLDFHRDVMFVR